MADKTTTAKWARWQWSKGLGRWHRLFTDGDLTKTACSAPRKSGSHVASTTAERPENGPVCPVCDSLDSILNKVMAGTLTDAIATTTIAAPMPLAPVGMCICGCDKSDEAVAYRAALAEWTENERARKSAAFDAFMATKAVAA
jgi:hypothetical protein